MSKPTPYPVVQPKDEAIVHARHGELVPSLWNRKNFNIFKLKELAESIKSLGIQQPIIVRRLPGSRTEETSQTKGIRPIYEIVAGERRWLGAGIAGLSFVPVIVRELTDEQVLDIQLIENLNRVDLTPLEEGEAYTQRMKFGGLSVDDVAAKIGRSREYVYSKTKLLDLCTEARAALRDEKIDASHALRIARIPDTKLQLKALEFATTPAQGRDGAMPSVLEFQRWLNQNVLLHLNKAVFKITDAKLVEAAGSCPECPKRTGANPDIFRDVEGADICTDPGCFNGKTSAHRAAIMAKAEAKGMTVIDGAEAKKICNANSSGLKGYSPLSQQRLDVDDSGSKQLGKLLGNDAPSPVLIENPWTKELIEAVPTVEAEAVLIAKGLIKTTTTVRDADAAFTSKVAQLKGSMAIACEKGARKAMFTALQDAIRSTPDDRAAALISPAVIRAWLTDRLYDLDHEDTATVLQVDLAPKNYSTTEEEAARLRLQGCDTATLFKALALYILLDDRDSASSSEPQLFHAMAGTTRINLQAVRKASDKEIKAGVSDQIRELTEAHKKAQKQPTPTTPLAQPIDTPPATAKAGDGAKPKLKKQKLSGEEAQLGIAEAMQGIEGAPATGALRPVDAWPFPGAPKTAAAPTKAPKQAHGFTVGQHVKVGAKAESRKYRGQSGKVFGFGKELDGQALVLVNIGGTNPCGFPPKDLELEPAGDPDGTVIPAAKVDPLFTKAAKLVVKQQRASVRLLKTDLGVGTAKAMEIMTWLEEQGKVSSCDQRGARTVLVAA
jgi:ParB/RepB/Spo0J family partition protein